MVEISSKKGVVSKAPYELFMLFTDMRNFVAMLPEDKKEGVEADYDWIRAQVQGFSIGVKVTERVPYSKICYADDGAPFKFFAENRAEWAENTCFVYPGAIQYFGPTEVCDATTVTLALEQGK